MGTRNFVSSFPLLIRGNLTQKLSTKLAQKYLNKIYNSATSNHFTGDKEQWNVVISDHFPNWLKNTSIIFDSFHQHMDIFLMCNGSDEATKLRNDVKAHLSDVLVIDDGNTSIRGNHLMLVNVGAQNYVEVVKQTPTFKNYLATSKFLHLY